MSTHLRFLLVFLLSVGVVPTLGCGSDDVELTDSGPGGGDGDGDGDGDDDAGGDGDGDGDGGGGGDPTCTQDGPQCNNCIDDDGDGLIDGADIECTGAQDNDEGSFATGIPGDNKDLKKQDCFFDGDSGDGNDGCTLHVCCIQPSLCEGPDSIDNQFDETANCQVSDKCSMNCGAVTPPGCDCLGCCTVCGQVDGADGCADIAINPLLYPPECSDDDPNNDPDTCCDADHLENCVTCEPLDDCGGGACDMAEDDCVLCPGETEEDLPDTCESGNECPGGLTACDTTDDCGAGEYCSAGCCILDGID